MFPTFRVCSRYSKTSREKTLTSDSQMLFPNSPSPVVAPRFGCLPTQLLLVLENQVCYAAKAATGKSARGKIFSTDITLLLAESKLTKLGACLLSNHIYCESKRIATSHPQLWKCTQVFTFQKGQRRIWGQHTFVWTSLTAHDTVSSQGSGSQYCSSSRGNEKVPAAKPSGGTIPLHNVLVVSLASAFRKRRWNCLKSSDVKIIFTLQSKVIESWET